MGKAKYTFRHFIAIDGEKKEIDPTKVEMISDQCKLLWTNLATGKEHIFLNEAAQ